MAKANRPQGSRNSASALIATHRNKLARWQEKADRSLATIPGWNSLLGDQKRFLAALVWAGNELEAFRIAVPTISDDVTRIAMLRLWLERYPALQVAINRRMLQRVELYKELSMDLTIRALVSMHEVLEGDDYKARVMAYKELRQGTPMAVQGVEQAVLQQLNINVGFDKPTGDGSKVVDVAL